MYLLKKEDLCIANEATKASSLYWFALHLILDISHQRTAVRYLYRLFNQKESKQPGNLCAHFIPNKGIIMMSSSTSGKRFKMAATEAQSGHTVAISYLHRFDHCPWRDQFCHQLHPTTLPIHTKTLRNRPPPLPQCRGLLCELPWWRNQQCHFNSVLWTPRRSHSTIHCPPHPLSTETAQFDFQMVHLWIHQTLCRS